MYYWRKNHFDGLSALAEHYDGQAAYQHFVQFCRLMEQGLRKPALKALNAFVAEAKTRPLEQQRELVVELVMLSHAHPEVYALKTHPLLVYQRELLQAWSAEAPEDVVVHRCLAILWREPEHYEKLLSLDPDDQMALGWMINANLSSVDFQGHHLYESYFIGSVEHADKLLDEAEAMLARIQDEQQQTRLANSLGYYRRMLRCWQAFSAAAAEDVVGSDAFPRWCEQHGEDFEYSKAIYYEV